MSEVEDGRKSRRACRLVCVWFGHSIAKLPGYARLCACNQRLARKKLHELRLLRGP